MRLHRLNCIWFQWKLLSQCDAFNVLFTIDVWSYTLYSNEDITKVVGESEREKEGREREFSAMILTIKNRIGNESSTGLDFIP